MQHILVVINSGYRKDRIFRTIPSTKLNYPGNKMGASFS
jgi:hypothetical protein